MGLVKNSNCIYFRYCARLLYETRTKIYYPTLLRLLALQATASTHKWPGVDLKILQAEGRLDSKLQIALGNMPIPWETSMGKPTKAPQWRFDECDKANEGLQIIQAFVAGLHFRSGLRSLRPSEERVITDMERALETAGATLSHCWQYMQENPPKATAGK